MEGRRARRQDRGPAWKGRVQSGEMAALGSLALPGFRLLVCAGFCTFFKEEREDEAACAGLQSLACLCARDPQVASHLAQAIAPLCGPVAPVDYQFDAVLERILCRGCPFLPDAGCDHRNPAVSVADKLEPCGGYIVVAALLGAGLLQVNDVGELEAP